MKDVYQYFVEGDDEKRLIEVLKTDMRLIQPGKIQVVNVVQERLTGLKLRVLSEGTILIFVFDTDTGNIDILNENIKKAKKSSRVKEVYCITQVKNIEDELIRSTDIKRIEELLGSKSKTDFKRDIIRERNLKQKLVAHSFDLNMLWCKEPQSPFENIRNESGVAKNKL